MPIRYNGQDNRLTYGNVPVKSVMAGDVCVYGNLGYDVIFTYTQDDQSVTITGLTEKGKTMSSIVIPSVINKKSVTSISENAFQNCSMLTSVVIPNSVTSIGSASFSGCNSLNMMTIPFVGAEAGKTSSDTYQYPFGYIFGTSSYTGSEAVSQGYYGTSISSTTFTRYYIPSSLRSVTVTGGNILRGAFDNCSMLTSVTMPDNITSIGSEAFYGCYNLISITIPEGVTSIEYNAFWSCYKLVEVYNKSALNIVAGSSDYGTVAARAKNVYTEEGGSRLSTYDDLVFYYDGTVGYLVGYYEAPQSNLILPNQFVAYDGTKLYTYEVGSYAFYRCQGLTSVSIIYNSDVIGVSAFESCKNITEVLISTDVSSTIKNYAFRNCSSLSKIILNGVTSIGNSAFQSSNLTSVTIPRTVTSIGRSVFNGSELTSADFLDTTNWQVSQNTDFSTYTSISSDDLSNTSTAATYLTSTYYNYYWRRV